MGLPWAASSWPNLTASAKTALSTDSSPTPMRRETCTSVTPPA
jgi:hypothetical protein